MILLLSSGLVIGYSVFMAVIALAFISCVIWSAGGKTKEVETFDNSLCDGGMLLVEDTPENNKKTFDELKSKQDEIFMSDEMEKEFEKYATPPPNELAFFDSVTIAFMKKNATPRYSNHPVWIKAFDLYNRSNKPLSRLCSPCYFKVLQYIIHLKNSENEKSNKENNQEKSGNPGC